MGHIHHEALRLLRETMIGVPEATTKHDDVCRGCVLGIFSKATFPNTNNGAKGVLKLIHYNICGLFFVKSLRVYDYFVTFIDDYFRKTWIYFLTT